MAETIVFGGQKLEIDENDPLWIQLVDKYSKKNQTSWEELNVCKLPEPLTYKELDLFLESEEYEEVGVYVYVRELPYSFVTVAVLDWFDDEVLAVYGIENVMHGRDYGKTWVAYRTPPVFEE